MDKALIEKLARVFDNSAEPLAIGSCVNDMPDGDWAYANAAYHSIHGLCESGIEDRSSGESGTMVFDQAGGRQFRVVTGSVAPQASAEPPAVLGTVAPMLNAVGNGIVIHSDFRPLFANPSAAAMLGMQDAEAVLEEPTLLRFASAESLPLLLERHLAAMDGEMAAPETFGFINAAGNVRWLEISESLVSLGLFDAVMMTLVDASDRMGAQRRETLLREAIDNLSDSFVLYDADERVVLTNQRFHEVFPYLPPHGAIIGAQMIDLVRSSVEQGAVTDPTFRKEETDAWIENFINLRRRAKLALSEDTWPNGRWDLVKEQRLDSGGFVSVRTDITERKRVEFALKDQEARLNEELAERTKHLSAVLFNIAQGVMVLSPALEVVLTNQGFHDLLDCPVELGKPGTPVSQLIADRLRRGILYSNEEGAAVDLEALVAERVASYRSIKSQEYSKVKIGDKSIEARRERLSGGSFIVTYTDVSDRVKAEQEVERQREALHQGEKLSALGMLLAGVAHELNNPLQVVLGNAALLESDMADSDQAKRAGVILHAAERCAKIIKTFLDMARDTPASRRPVKVNELVEQALDLMGHQLGLNDITVDLKLSPSLPDVVGDPDQLNQVIVNLLINAMQAMEASDHPKRIVVRTAAVEPGCFVELTVDDTGLGVPDDVKGRIFDPFFTTKPLGVGTGIGLAVCHGMIAAHSGTIIVEDAPGGGARFCVKLPCRDAASGDDADQISPSRDARAGRVLVVDDEPEIRELIGDILQALDLSIDGVPDGREALKRLRMVDYDVVICDLWMPNMDGKQLYAEVAQHLPHLLHRFVFATGDLLGEPADKFLAECGCPSLTKPFIPNDVRQAVSRLLNDRAQS